jgi:hypothetical protein
MNIDERLAALVQSVELLASFHKDNQKTMAVLAQEMKHFHKHSTRLEGLVTQIAEGTARLLNAVESHEQRINRMETRGLQ